MIFIILFIKIMISIIHLINCEHKLINDMFTYLSESEENGFFPLLCLLTYFKE